jgi:hypothetical protein
MSGHHHNNAVCLVVWSLATIFIVVWGIGWRSGMLSQYKTEIFGHLLVQMPHDRTLEQNQHLPHRE